jgi:hypothetical protein
MNKPTEQKPDGKKKAWIKVKDGKPIIVYVPDDWTLR